MLMIREARKAKGLTMKQLGAMLGVSESAMSQYETGKRRPDYELLLKLSEILDCSVDYLLRGDDVNNTPTPATPTLSNVYLSFAQEAQDKNIDPDDIREALELIEKLKHKNN